MTVKKIIGVTEDMALFFNSTNGQHSIRALKHLPGNVVLHTFNAKEYIDSPTYLSVQVDEDRHLHLSPEFLQYINHSCEPNTFFDTKKQKVVVIKDICKNEEITFFYPSTEWSMTQPFECLCQTKSCLGKIHGAAYLDEKSLGKYRFSEHIQKKLSAKKLSS